MKAKHKRLLFFIACLVVMGLAATAILYSFRDNLVFFYTPTQLNAKRDSATFDVDRPLRIGGLVKHGSVINLAQGGIQFTVTDLTADLTVIYRGMIPSLFREGQGVVAQGMLHENTLNAETILAKHDENYMPREVVDELKKSGKWQAIPPGTTRGSPATMHHSSGGSAQ
jgi:cytochrome c-type biogenesis protein CcmE